MLLPGPSMARVNVTTAAIFSPVVNGAASPAAHAGLICTERTFAARDVSIVKGYVPASLAEASPSASCAVSVYVVAACSPVGVPAIAPSPVTVTPARTVAPGAW